MFVLAIAFVLIEVSLKIQEVMDMAGEVGNALVEDLSHPRGYPAHLIRDFLTSMAR